MSAEPPAASGLDSDDPNGRRSDAGIGRRRQPAGVSVGDQFPDQLGDVDHQIGPGLTWIARCADLADRDTDNIVQSAIGLAIGQMKQCPDDLTAPRWIGAAIAVPLHHDRGPIVGLDDGAEVRPEGPSAPSFRGKFAPRKRPVIDPSQRPSAIKKSCCQPPSRPTAQLSG